VHTQCTQSNFLGLCTHLTLSIPPLRISQCIVLWPQGLTTLLQYTHGYIIMHHLITMLGHLSPEIFVQLLEGKASFLKGCGITVTMPSAEALSQASPDVIDRIQAIKEVNLSGMINLAGESRGLKASSKEWSRNFLHSPHYHVHLPPLNFKATLTPSRTALSHRWTSRTAISSKV